MIKIITWLNDLNDADLILVHDVCKEAQGKGRKVTLLEGLDVEPYGAAVVVYEGKGTKAQLRKAFTEAWND